MLFYTIAGFFIAPPIVRAVAAGNDLILLSNSLEPDPDLPRGFVRDIRVRWALEEAGLPYRVESVSFDARNADHFSHQPFGQVPWLTDGDLSIFESGAILLHLAGRGDALMPADPRGRSQVLERDTYECTAAARDRRFTYRDTKDYS